MKVLAWILALAFPVIVCVGVWLLTGSVAWTLLTLGGLILLGVGGILLLYLGLIKIAVKATKELTANLDEV